MKRLGLALSGGGFRATLYHLGVVRCLRDAGVLPKITHITTVSGGSILGAHLVLNWDRYCGTPEQFDEAAAEIIRFVQLDVRNRIVRRFPFAAAANKVRSLLMLGPRRQWTRAGLLERYYERYLYGDTRLSQLPDHPKLHILSPDFTPLDYEAAAVLDEPDHTGFDVLSESRVFDLRGWSDSNSQAIGYTRTRVRRLPEVENNSTLRLQRDIAIEEYLIDCKSKRLNPQLSRMELEDGMYRWELQLDFSHVPLNSHAEIVSQSILPSELASVVADEGRFSFTVRTKTGLLQVWLLMPEGRDYGLCEVSSHPIGKPESAEIVVPAAVVRVALDSVATFQLINPEPDRRYECRWIWSEPTDAQ